MRISGRGKPYESSNGFLTSVKKLQVDTENSVEDTETTPKIGSYKYRISNVFEVYGSGKPPGAGQ
jgi:hypothetical protein